jgi:glycosyltransferase involved in cell wall biosynthesis
MKIGIDVSQIVHQGTGVAHYTQNLVASLLKIDKKNQYLLFGGSLRQKRKLDDYLKQFKNQPNVTLKTFSLPPLFLELLWNKWHVFSLEKLIGQVDVFLSSDWLQPPTKAKKVTTIHDLIVFKYPESFQPKGGHNIVANQKRRLEWVKRECDLIICDSEATKKDAIKILGIEEEKIRVIYPGGR